MIINPIIKHLLPDAPATSPPLPTPQGLHQRKPEDWSEWNREGGRDEREGGRYRGREKEGWGKRAVIQKGHQIAGFFHTGEVLLCRRTNVCGVMWLQNKRNHREEEEAGTFHQRRRIEKWKRDCTPHRERHPFDQTAKLFFNLPFLLSSSNFYSHFHPEDFLIIPRKRRETCLKSVLRRTATIKKVFYTTEQRSRHQRGRLG